MSSDDPMILDFASSSDPSYKSHGFAILIMAFILLPKYRKLVYIKLGYYVQIFLTPIVCVQVDFNNAFSKVFVRPLCENYFVILQTSIWRTIFRNIGLFIFLCHLVGVPIFFCGLGWFCK